MASKLMRFLLHNKFSSRDFIIFCFQKYDGQREKEEAFGQIRTFQDLISRMYYVLKYSIIISHGAIRP